MQSGVPPPLAMDATTREKISPSFFCSTCGTPLSGLEDSGAYCPSCLADIPAPANEQASNSSGLSTKEPIFKFFCQQCDQKFSSPVGFAGSQFICPICSTENTVPLNQSNESSRETTTPSNPLPVPQDQFFPEFGLERDITNLSSGLSEQLLLRDDAGNTIETPPRRGTSSDTTRYNLEPCHSHRQLSRNESHELDEPAPVGISAGNVEPEDNQPIRITHPIHGKNRTILPRRRAKEKPGELTPIRLRKEASALPAPNVKQPDPVPRKAFGFPHDSCRQNEPIDQLFSDEIEIEKIFPVTNTQV